MRDLDLAKLNKVHCKITPYKFPTKKHSRTENPRKFKVYSSYKSILIREFNAQCVYCRSLLTFGGRGTAAIEHYRPKINFPELRSDYANLFLSCMRCNAFKGSYWSDTEEYRIINPCDDVMSQHLSFADLKVNAVSDRGKVHTELLKLNDVERLSDRNTVNIAIRLAIEKLLAYKNYRHPTSEMSNDADKVCEMLSTFTGVSVEKLGKLLT